MSTTVLEALQNSRINFENLGRMGIKNNPFFIIAMEQLENAIDALENDKDLNDVIQEDMLGDVELFG